MLLTVLLALVLVLVVCSGGALRNRVLVGTLSVIVVDRRVDGGKIRVHELLPRRRCDVHAVPGRAVHAVDGLVVEGVVDRVLRVGDRDERRDLVRHEACGGHHRVLVGAGLGEGLAIVVKLRGRRFAARLHDTLVQRVGHGLRDVRVDGLMAVRGRHFHLAAAAVGHLGDGDRSAFHAVGAHGGVHVGHGQRRRLHRTDGHWRLERVSGVDVGRVGDGVVVAHLLGRVGDRAQTDVRRHRGLRGVVRLDQTLQRAFRRGGAAAGILHPPRADETVAVAVELRRVVDGGCDERLVDGVAFLHPRHHVDGLPGGADVEAHTAAVLLIDHVVHGGLGLVRSGVIRGVVGSVDAERQDFAGARLHGRYHHFESGRVCGRHGAVRRLHGRVVGVAVERGDDLQTAFLQQLLASLVVLAERLVLQDLVDHVRAEEAGVFNGRLASGAHVLQVQRILQRRVDGVFEFLFGGDVALVVHQLQHDVALVFGFLLVGFHGRIEVLRILGDCRDGRRLGHVQFRSGDVEVAFGGHFHAAQVVAAELRDVEVALQDLGFGVFLFDLHRDQHLAQLACHGVFRRMVFGDRIVVFTGLGGQHVLDVLLRQRGTALLVAASDVGLEERSEHALHVHAGMFEEALVFTGHDGLLHGFGDFLQRHDLAVLRIEFRESGLAVVEIHRRALRKRGHIEIDAFDRKGRNDGFGRVIGGEHSGHKENTRHNAAAHA